MTVNLQVLLKINVLHNVQKTSLRVDHTEDILGQYMYLHMLTITHFFNQSKWRETPINGTSVIMVFPMEKNILRTKVNILRRDEEEYWDGRALKNILREDEKEYSEGNAFTKCFLPIASKLDKHWG